jgi:hypothetical protein
VHKQPKKEDRTHDASDRPGELASKATNIENFLKMHPTEDKMKKAKDKADSEPKEACVTTILKAGDKGKDQIDDKPKKTLKERRDRKYSFPNEDVAQIFEDLLELGEIQLPPPKKPEEKDKIDHPLYCKYHQFISHKLEDCFILKDLIKKLIDDKVITISGASTSNGKGNTAT